MNRLLDRIKPRRKIDANSAVFLPFTPAGTPDFAEFEKHLLRTWAARITPAVNMDTGFGPQLGPGLRDQVLRLTRKALGTAPFIAGAFAEGGGTGPGAYESSLRSILEQGGIPIVFQSDALRGLSGEALAACYERMLKPCPQAIGFELGEMFAPFGRIYDLETYRRLLGIPNLIGAKHSSLSRAQELARLELRDRERPEFKVYTGNDLAIDMVMYGSDYLLGLSTFDPEAFALRDRWWSEGDDRFFELNDALQALGAVVFRDPVPAYKDSAAVYLGITGRMTAPLPHPSCVRRPPLEPELLKPFARRIDLAAGR